MRRMLLTVMVSTGIHYVSPGGICQAGFERAAAEVGALVCSCHSCFLVKLCTSHGEYREDQNLGFALHYTGDTEQKHLPADKNPYQRTLKTVWGTKAGTICGRQNEVIGNCI
ncbi:hypothetical protein Y1Q_0014458 [Alligator mississippiensis]|nr:hypothetical protein Y1Q_0014458 [Alligator mississippiensis]